MAFFTVFERIVNNSLPCPGEIDIAVSFKRMVRWCSGITLLCEISQTPCEPET